MASYCVNFGGKFNTVDRNTVEYRGGLVEIVECDPPDLWNALERVIPVALCRQRVWYKLPYETLSELKLLWRESGNFQRMCEIAQWVSVIDIYMEEDEEDEDNVVTPTRDEGPVETEPVQEPETVQETETAATNQETAPTNQETETHVEEEARIEAVIADVNEESDVEEMPKTPDCSDNEEEEDPNKYDKYVIGSGVLKINQVFTSGEEFKEGVLQYSLNTGWNVKYARWGPVKYEAICANAKKKEPCEWRVYCSYDKSAGGWLVKTINETHTCMKDGRCKLLTDNIIARMFVNELRINPKMQPKDMQSKIEEKYNVVCTHDQIRKAKKKALKIIQKEYDEQYSKIKDYTNEIRR